MAHRSSEDSSFGSSTTTEAFPSILPPAPAPIAAFDLADRPSATDISSASGAPRIVASESSLPQNPASCDLKVDVPPAPKSASHIPPLPPLSPGAARRRRSTRTNTFRTLEEFEEYETQPGWRPGAEPGIDPKKPDGGQDAAPDLHAECQITVVDFSQDDLKIHEVGNAGLIELIKQPQPSWAKCRWINVNGLSWDVIQALGKYKDLHRLAIEDLMNTRNRTKVDW